MSEFQTYIASFTIVAIFALYRVTQIAIFVIDRYAPNRGQKDQ